MNLLPFCHYRRGGHIQDHNHGQVEEEGMCGEVAVVRIEFRVAVGGGSRPDPQAQGRWGVFIMRVVVMILVPILVPIPSITTPTPPPSGNLCSWFPFFVVSPFLFVYRLCPA